MEPISLLIFGIVYGIRAIDSERRANKSSSSSSSYSSSSYRSSSSLSSSSVSSVSKPKSVDEPKNSISKPEVRLSTYSKNNSKH